MKNEGGIDRAIRILVGLGIIGWGYMNQNWWGAVGAVPLLTGLMGWCPAYSLLGINTCPMKKDAG